MAHTDIQTDGHGDSMTSGRVGEKICEDILALLKTNLIGHAVS